jgi:nitroreductase
MFSRPVKLCILGLMEILPEIQNRFSINSFSDRSVSEEVLHRILEAGRLAPSAKNRQPWRYVVVEDKNVRAKIAEASYNEQHVKEAPVIIAVCSTNLGYTMPNGQLAYPLDLSFGASFMMLQAEHEGLGTCLITTYDQEEMGEILTIPHSMRVVLLLLLGYSAEKKNSRNRLPARQGCLL